MHINKVNANDIRTYRNDVLKNSSASTLERKMFSLKKFFEWAVKEGYTETNPVEEFFKSEEAAIEVKVERIEKQKKLSIPSYHSVEARIIAKLAGKPKLQKLAYNVFYARPKWYKSYHTLPISNYFNYAILILLMSAMGFGIYNQFFKTTSQPLAYPTSLTRAGRYLSFQGRLTNALGNPITTATNIVFKLYDTGSGGTTLWNSGTCSITPDTDGIFSTLLGSSCGSEITSSVFTENAAVWLGVTVGTDAEATPRVQIATVAYALNSETLQGYPASSSATANTVPVINSSGFMVLASSSPKIQSTSGNFALEGQAMTLSTPDTSNGSITINPDGTGTINLTFEGSAPGGSAQGFVNATNANLASGSLYYGEVANDAAGYNLLELASGATPRTKFAIDSAGNATLSGTINGLAINAGAITTGTWNGTAIGTEYGGTGQNWSSVAQGSVPYFNGTGTMSTLAPSTAGYVLSTNGDNANPSWIPTSGVGTNYWQLANHVLAPANALDYDLAVGGNSSASAKLLINAATGNLTTTGTASISGNLTLGNGSAFQSAYGPLTLNYKSGADAWATGLTVVDVSGNIKVVNDIYSSATTANLFNTITTTLNIGGAASTLTLGAASGTTTFGSTTMTLGGNSTLNGGSAASGTMQINSTSNATKGNLSFNGTTTYIDGLGNLKVGGYATASASLALGNTTAAAGPGHLNMSGNLTAGGTINGLTVSSGTISSGTWNGTAIGATYGGTGQTGYAVGDLLYADSTTSLAKLSDVAIGNVLISGGVNTAPSWGKVVLGTHTTGNYVSSLAGTANQITASGSTGDITLSIPSDFRAPGTVNAVNGLYTGATAGTQRIDASGNLTNIANISASGYATISGNLTLGNGSAFQSAYGPLTLNYKSGANTWAAGLTLTNSGYVGIGTTSPNDKLEINGNLRISGATNPITISNTSLSSASFAELNIQTANNNTSTLVRLYPKGTPSSQPASNLQLFNTDWGASQTNYESLEYRFYNNVAQLLSSAGGTGVVRPVQITTGSNNGIYVNSSGQIGLGTLSPTTNTGVDIVTSVSGMWGAGSGSLRLQNTNTGNTATVFAMVPNSGSDFDIMLFGSGATPANKVILDQRNNAPLSLSTNDTERITILGGGNVGIGATSPTAKLDVNGNLNVSGYATASASLALGNTTAAAGPGHLNMSGNLTAGGTINGLTISSGTISSGTWNGTAIGTEYGGTGQNWSSVAQGSVPYFNGTGAMTTLAAGDSGQILSTTGTGIQWIDAPSGSGTNYWALGAGGTIYPGNTTLDLLLGSSASASAKFAFKNVLTGVPTASISGTTANVATFIDGNGNISTTNRTNLVLGNSSTYDSTGNVLINPSGTGNVGIGTTSPTGKFDIWNNSALTSYLYQATADTVGPVLTLRKSRGTTGSPSNSLSTDTLGTLNFQGRSGAWFSLASIAAAHDTGNNNARLTFSTADATTLTERMRIEYTGDVGIGTTAPDKALEINSATGSNLRLTYNDSNGSATTYADFSMSSSGDLTITPSGGQVVIPSTASLNAGGITEAAYSAFAGSSDAPSSTAITTTNDLFIGGDQEIKGGLYLTGKNIYNVVGGVSTGTITFATDPTAVNNYNALSYGSWLVNNSVNNGIAALMVNQNKGTTAIGDIFTASASGTTKFTIHNDSSFTMAGLAVAPTSNTAAGTVYFNTATTTGGGTTGSLFMMGEDSNWHRVALDMTQYSGTNASLANASALTVTHNQNTADLTASGWVYNTVTSTWNSISTFTHNIIQNLQNQFDAAGSVNVRTQTRLSNIELKPAVDLGTGADGDITLSSSSNINTTAFISGRTCADAVNYNVSSINAAGTEATLSTTPSSGCLSAGDEVLLINLQGISSAYGNTGNYETLRVSSVSTNVVTFQTAKTKYYGNGTSDDTNLGTAITNQRVMLQRVPNYNDVTISSGGTLTVSAWDGQKGGVVFFRANGTVTVGSGGSISATGLGYLGGTGPTSYSNNTPSGESVYTAAASANEGYGAGVAGPASNPGYAGTFSGGGGGSKYLTSGTAIGGAGNSTTPAGGGGGGGSATRYNTSTGHGYGGGGGGGGYGAYGYAGTNGSTATGSDGTASTSGAGGTSAYSTHNYGGGGGGGAGNYGTTSLTKLYFGSGGGAGGVGHHYSGTSYNGGDGGDGGGIVYVSANSLSVSGTVASNGGVGTTDGTTTLEGPGGGGAGGSVKVEGVSLTLGTSLVTASGGLGGTNTTSNDGGDGGTGLIAVNYATTLSGTTSPSATSSVLGYNTYGVYNSSTIPTANAVNLEEIRWEASPSANGKIELQTRSGNSTDPTDGTWEAWKPAANTTTCASPNCVALETEAANYYTNWSGTNATVAVGDVTRDVDQYEDDNQTTATKLTKITSSTNGGYAGATVSVDLSSYDYLALWVRASQTGNTIKIGMGEIAATEQEETITIDTANTWQKVYWDLSDIPTGSRNTITKLRLTNLTSASNTIYIGYVHGEKLLTTSSGSAITSTPNNYIQYRAVFTTTNTAYQPKLYNVNIDYNDGFKIVKATDNNSVSLYNYTGSSQNVRLDVVTFGADLAEWYTVDDNNIEGGDLVAITGQMDEDGVPILSKAKGKNDPNLIGIISTNAGQMLGIQSDNRRLLALAGRVPVKIDPDSPTISAGDGITSSDKTGMARKATYGDVVIAKAAQAWTQGQGDKIFVIVNNASSTNAYLTSINDYQIVKSLADDTFSVVDSTTQEIAKNVAVFSNMIAANIKAGVIITKELVAEKLETTVATIQELTAPKIAVNLISPIPGSTNVTVQIGSEATPSGQFAIQNSDGSTVAAIDSMGNASFSATIASNQLTVESEATISGTLYADNIKSKSLDEIETLLTQVQTDQNLLKEAADWNILTSTNSANLNQLALADLFITNQAAVNSLSVTNSLAIGTDMIFGPLNSLDTLTSPLKIQGLAMAPIEMMSGLVKIDTNGNVQITGNLAVAGNIESRSLNLVASSEATTSADLMTFQDSTGNDIASIDTSGSANFVNVSTQGLTIAGAINATTSATVDGVITTNATAGSATIPAGTSEISIRNSSVTNYTLVYITPTSSTENYVLYVKSKKDGEFVVGFTNPINIDVNFNWWIVKVAQ